MFNGEKKALDASKQFTKIFAKKENPDNMPTFTIKTGPLNPVVLLTEMKFVASKGEAKRLIEGGGLKINQEKVVDWRKNISVKSGDIIQAGKRRFGRIR